MSETDTHILLLTVLVINIFKAQLILSTLLNQKNSLYRHQGNIQKVFYKFFDYVLP